MIRLALPDGSAFARDLIDSLNRGEAGAGREYNVKVHAHPMVRPTLKRRLTQALSSPPHRWQPTPDLIHELLAAAGFRNTKQYTFRHGSLPDLAAVEHREESIFVEGS